MNYIRNTLIFLFLMALHVELLFIFSASLYLLYFINLVFVLYLLNRYIKDYPMITLALHVALILIIINLNIYDEYIFEVLLHFDILGKLTYINSEVMYALSIVHLLVFINLKRLGEILGYNKVKLF